MSRVLFIGMGRTGRPYARAAHALGLRVAVVDHAVTLKSPRTRALLNDDDQCYAVSHDDQYGWYSAAAKALADGPVAGVVAFSEPHVVPAALLCEQLGLPGPGLHAALTSRDKSLQRNLFARHGLAQTDFHVAIGRSDALDWAEGRYPVVAKPLHGAGSAGVRLIGSADELRTWCDGATAGERFLVERFLSGAEYSVECVVHEGTVLFTGTTGKTTTPPPYYVEVEHRVPTELADSVRERVAALAHGVAAALRMRAGVMHLEFRVEDGVPHIMEVAVRTPGDHILELHELATGVDVFRAIISVATGRAPDVAPTRSGVAASWFPPVPAGRISSLAGLDEALRVDGVVDIRLDAGVGDEVAELRSSDDRVVSVLLSGEEAQDLARTRKQVDELLRIVVEPVCG